MVAGDDRKQAYFVRFTKMMEEYPRILIVVADNIGSNHMQSIRRSLKGKAVILMGKNTMVRKCLRGLLQTNPQYESLLPHIKGNVGFVFTKEDLSSVKKVLEANKKQAPAKAGALSPVDVIIPAGNTGLEPTQTSFLQALNIASKISKGTVEIISDVLLLKVGDKVGASESALLTKLNIKPFMYGLRIKAVYDNGTVFESSVLDIDDNDLLARFRNGVRNVACVSLATGEPTLAAVPHLIVNGYKNVLAISMATNYTIDATKQLKEMLANPAAFAAKAAPAAAKEDKKDDKKGGGKDDKKKEKEKEKEKEPEPPAEDDEPMFNLFG